jgi:hypothetical protein
MTVHASDTREQSICASVITGATPALRASLISLGFTDDLPVPGTRDGSIHHRQLDWPEGGRIKLSSVDERPDPNQTRNEVHCT